MIHGLGNPADSKYMTIRWPKEIAVAKKVWRKPEVHRIAAGSAESANVSGSDGATTGTKKS